MAQAATPGKRVKTRRFLHKLFERNFDVSGCTRMFYINQRCTNKLYPPQSPSKKAQPGSNIDALPNYDLIRSLDNLSLSDGRNQSDPSFVGGFHPRYGPSAGKKTQLDVESNNTPLFTRPLPVPPAMPIPEAPKSRQQSLTMQMALRPSNEEIRSPYSSTPLPHPRTVPPAFVAPVAVSASAPRPRVHTPTKPQRPRAASSPVVSSSPSIIVQCAGITQENERCTRRFKVGPALCDNDDHDPLPVDRFCFQHARELLVPSGFFSRKTRDWVEFNGKFTTCEAHNFFLRAIRVDPQSSPS